MPARLAHLSESVARMLQSLGRDIRGRRKALGVSATVAAQSAGMSRVTWHRLEKGEAAITLGAYVSAAQALGLTLRLDQTPAVEGTVAGREGWIPARVRLTDYPQLRQLAWQVQGVDSLTPREALDIYERNERLWDAAALTPAEAQLIEALRLALAS